MTSHQQYTFIWTGSQANCDKHVTSALCFVAQDKGEGLSGDLLVKQINQNVSVSAGDEYKHRVSMASNSSLLLSAAKLSDQRIFTCMIVAGADIMEYSVNVVIFSEYHLPKVDPNDVIFKYSSLTYCFVLQWRL